MTDPLTVSMDGAPIDWDTGAAQSVITDLTSVNVLALELNDALAQAIGRTHLLGAFALRDHLMSIHGYIEDRVFELSAVVYPDEHRTQT